jgi:hypothetical protein
MHSTKIEQNHKIQERIKNTTNLQSNRQPSPPPKTISYIPSEISATFATTAAAAAAAVSARSPTTTTTPTLSISSNTTTTTTTTVGGIMSRSTNAPSGGVNDQRDSPFQGADPPMEKMSIDETISIPDSITDSKEYEFLTGLFEFHADNDTLSSLHRYPVMNNQPLNLMLLFNLVCDYGGYSQTVKGSPEEIKEIWTNIYKKLDRNYDPNHIDENVHKLREFYVKFLLDYESEIYSLQSTKQESPSTPPVANITTSEKQRDLSISEPSKVSPSLSDRSRTIVFRFYLTKNWLTSRKLFMSEKPSPVIDVQLELFDNPISNALLRKLPILEHCNKFGEQLIYFTCPNIPTTEDILKTESTANDVIPYGSLGYWRAGSSLVLGWGKTPAAINNECRLLEACTIIGKWTVSSEKEKEFSNTLTNTLSPVTHAMTQIQLKRRIERTADQHRDLSYIIVEVQTADYFRSENAHLHKLNLAKQVFKPSPPATITTAISPSFPQSQKVTSKIPSTPGNNQNYNKAAPISNVPKALSPMSPSPAESKPLPHPVHNGLPPQMIPTSVAIPQSIAQRDMMLDANAALEQKRKQTSEQRRQSVSDTKTPVPNNADLVQQYKNPGPVMQPMKSNFAVHSPSVIMLPSQVRSAKPNMNGTKRAAQEAEDSLDSRTRKKMRQPLRKLPSPAPLSDRLTEVKTSNQTDIYQLIIRYKYKGESDNDCRMVKKILKLSRSSRQEDIDDDIIIDSSDIPTYLTGGNIVYFLQQDNVDLQDIEEVRYYEKGEDVDSSGWVLLEDDYKFNIEQVSNDTSATSKEPPKIIIKLLLKRL